MTVRGTNLPSTDPSLWVVVPAYQEGQAIADTILEISRYAKQIVVVDDGSTDGTAASARAHGATVISHALNLGQGAALQTGLDFALRHGADLICTFDADGQHDAATIPLMRERLLATGTSVALGSRFLGEAIDLPPLRRVILKAAVAFTRLQTGLPLTDTHNGLRMFTRTAASRLRIRHAGMAHGSEILSSIAALGLSTIEVPTAVRYTEYSRRKGQRISNSVKIVFDLMYAALCR